MSSDRVSLFAFMIAVLFSQACTNVSRMDSRSPSSTVDYSDSFDGGSLAGNFRLITVLPSQNQSGLSYDMIGENEEFDTYCSGTSSLCQCEYTFDQAGSTQTITSNQTYQESNMIRCGNAVPSGIVSFSVRVLVTASGSTASAFAGYVSNSITVNLNSGTFVGSESYLDLTKEESFTPVERFQCRRRGLNGNPLVPYMLDNSIVDPIQSEDPRINYPFNFFTTNKAKSILKMQRVNHQDWECTLIETHDRMIHRWANPMVFSGSTCTDGFCSGDGELIYPTNSLSSGKIPVNNPSANGKRRSSFALASRAYGVFQTPVRAGIAPNSFVSSTYDTIGWAAKPIPGVTTSSCPNIPLPANAQWVKLWNFSVNDIEAPKYVTMNSYASTNSAIACSPNATQFESCTNMTPGEHRPMSSALGANQLYSRVVALISQNADDTGTPHSCYNIDHITAFTQPAGPYSVTGIERWRPSKYAFTGAFSADAFSADAAKALPWSMYEGIQPDGTSTPIINSCGAGIAAYYSPAACGGNVYPVPGVPTDTQLDLQEISTTTLSDQIFVVTDPNVIDSTMLAGGNSQYAPVTYRTKSECSGASRSGCTSTPITWGNNAKEVGNPASPDIYPLCVVQFRD